MKSTGTTTLWNMQVLKQCYDVLYQFLHHWRKRDCLKSQERLSQMQITSQENYWSINGSSFNAPAFYYTQVDLAGPFNTCTFHNKRKTIKIWLCVFCCSTTSTVSIKVMEDYRSSSFLQCFIRLSCEVGYPRKLLPDEESQLITGCGSMKIDFQNARFQLH